MEVTQTKATESSLAAISSTELSQLLQEGIVARVPPTSGENWPAASPGGTLSLAHCVALECTYSLYHPIPSCRGSCIQLMRDLCSL